MMGAVMGQQRPNGISRALKALLRLGLGVAIFAALAPAPASSGPLLEKCPAVKAISV
jgi:hypothetical protein